MSLTTLTVGPSSGGFGTMTFEAFLDFKSASQGNQGFVLPKCSCAFSRFSQQRVDLVNGANTTDVPANSAGLWFQPPTDNTTVTLTMKGVTGDTGTRISKTAPLIVFWDTASVPSEITITASGALNGCLLTWL